MYKIVFYRDKNGVEPVYEYLRKLRGKQSKDFRIKLNKIQDYIEILAQYGTMAGEPYVKHLEGDIWELRPLRDRILFAACVDNHFVLLHIFAKKTRKTPRREIVKAQKELQNYLDRGNEK